MPPEITTTHCLYQCVDGWLPLPNYESFPFSSFHEEREGHAQGRIYNTILAPQEFVLQTPCPACNGQVLVDELEEEPEVGMSRAATVELLKEAGAEVDEGWPDWWKFDGHWIQIIEVGPDTWQLQTL